MSERSSCPAGDGGQPRRYAVNGPAEYTCGHAWAIGQEVSGGHSPEGSAELEEPPLVDQIHRLLQLGNATLAGRSVDIPFVLTEDQAAELYRRITGYQPPDVGSSETPAE